MESINLITIITIAFLGSFGHCIGMCGGIVIAYSSTKLDKNFSKLMQTFAHLSYSFGRVTTYAILGAVFGFLGGVISFNHTTNGVLYLVAGLMMVLVGLSLVGKIKFLTSIEYSVSHNGWFQKNFKKLLKDKSYFSFYLLGMLNGLLPCGFVYFFAISAASSASPLWGAIVMSSFGLATIPALFALGYFVGSFKNSKFRDYMMKIASILVILYGLYTMYNGYIFITVSDSSLLNCH
jgi:sulfite exporter TauE/SafE